MKPAPAPEQAAGQYDVQLSDVTKVFARRGRKPLTAVSNVSLSVADGEFVCLIGPSGCGKSTLLSLIAGLAAPTSGSISFRGQPVLDTDPQRGMLFQSPALFPWLTVYENVMFGPKAQGSRDAATGDQARDLLARVGLADFADAYPKELSGGMRHRAAFARALINQPAVLLLDEPFAALDAITRMSMQQLLLDIWAEFSMSIVFVTHDVSEATLLGDRVVLMSARPGRIHSVQQNPIGRAGRRDVDSAEMSALRRKLRGELADAIGSGEPDAIFAAGQGGRDA
ncbi:MAG TPA: ABC transporter ATP-binding protein [Streptosporangiaceae bacterium]|nr:ABC transporter ATP-binding protein [Streptosporangiaceae bacterium]